MNDSQATFRREHASLTEVGTVTRMPGIPTLALAPQRAPVSQEGYHLVSQVCLSTRISSAIAAKRSGSAARQRNCAAPRRRS